MFFTEKYVDAEELHKALGTNDDWAVVDIREQEEFSRKHILLSVCIPLSRLELKASVLIPSRKTPIYLVDDGGKDRLDRAEKAAVTLAKMGYENIRILAGGLEAWENAGYVTVNGIGSLSKGFGEYIEETRRTPSLSPDEIKKLIDDPCIDSIVIDVRPEDEYHNMNIPGSRNLPGCEVAYRLGEIVSSPETVIIINCAGRTRSIIGTQTLINLSIPNQVYALRGGTMNWQLASHVLDYGSLSTIPQLTEAGKKLAQERIYKLAEKYEVKFVDIETLNRWKNEAEEKTLYIFDVRLPEEYNEGHLPGSVSAQGGQLVQATDEYAAVRNARYVLVDNDELRAIVAAHWLNQMGLPNVYVLKGGIMGQKLAQASSDHKLPEVFNDILTKGKIDPVAAKQMIDKDKDCIVLDIGSSKLHRQGHVPGSKWIMRSHLLLAKDKHPDARSIIVVSDSNEHAALGAEDARSLWPDAEVYFIDGGNSAWGQKGCGVEAGMPCPLCPEEDIWYRPYTDINASPDAMKGYFDWESGLVAKIAEDNCVAFKVK